MGRGIAIRGKRKLLLCSASALAMGVALSQSATAAACGSGADAVISTACTGSFAWTGGGLTVTSGGTIMGHYVGVGVSSGTIAYDLSNAGTITGETAGLINDAGTIGTITNAGKIGADYVYGLYNSGGIASIVNSGTITGPSTGLYNASSATIGELTNNGIISGPLGVWNAGTIGTLTNTGRLIGGYGADSGATLDLLYNTDIGTIDQIYNQGSITSLVNDGFLGGGLNGVANYLGTIGTFVNNGTISASGSTFALENDGTIGTLTNNGLILGQSNALYNSGSMLLVNWGTISGNIVNDGSLTISGATGGVFGTLTGLNGALGAIGNSFNFDSGALLLHDVISGVVTVIGTGGTLNNTGTMGGAHGALLVNSGASLALLRNESTITSTATISSEYAVDNRGSIGLIDNLGVMTASLGIISNSGTIDAFVNSGTVTVANNVIGILQSGTFGTISNTGLISTRNFLKNTGSIDTISNSATITVTALAINNSGGTITVIDNSGQIAAGNGTAVLNSGTIGMLTNSGQIVGAKAIANSGSIGSVINDSLISGKNALINSGWIGLLDNNSTIAGTSTSSYGNALSISGSIDEIDNSAGALISGSAASYGEPPADGNGIYVTGSIGQITNDGTINGFGGIVVDTGGTIGTIYNRNLGTIAAYSSGYAIANWAGTISLISNEGLLQGGIYNLGGTIDTVENYSGATISGGIISSDSGGTATIGEIINEGLISGNIYVQHPLTVYGNMTASFGTLTGGAITGDVIFAGGDLVLDDDGDGALLTNNGATLVVNRTLTLGNSSSFTQSSGTLKFGASGELLISGAANFTGGSIVVGDATSNYLFGDTHTLIAADGTSSYSGATVTAGFTGLTFTKATTGGTLVVTYTDDYIGGTLASFSESRSISGGAYAIYVGTTGNIGTLTNSGTLVGSTSAFYNAGTIGELDNPGTIGRTIGTGFTNSGHIGTIINTGAILGGNEGLRNAGGTIGLIRNEGILQSNTYAIFNTGSIGTIENVQNKTIGEIANTGVIDLIDNAGTVSASGYVIYSQGSIGTLRNSGLITSAYNNPIIQISGGNVTLIENSGNVSGTSDAFYVWAGRIGTLTNTGLIQGGRTGINNASSIDTLINQVQGTIIGAYTAIQNSGTIGTLTNSGSIGQSGNALSNSGTITLLTNDGWMGGGGINNAGVIGTLDNSGLIDGTAIGISNSTLIGMLTNTGTIRGGTYALYNTGSLVSIVNSSLIEGDIATSRTLTISGGSNGTVGTLTGVNGSIGTFSGPGLFFDTGALLLNDSIAYGVTVVGTGGSLTNTGLIGGTAAQALVVNSGASLSTLTNAAGGLIEGTSGAGISNSSSIGALTNFGTIHGIHGVLNSGTIDALDNRGDIHGVAAVSSAAGIYNYGVVSALTNSGTINASSPSYIQARTGIYNAGSIAALTNTGSIDGTFIVIFNSGAIDTIANSGRIVGSKTTSIAIYNGGAIGTLTNSGVMSGINNYASWTAIDNEATGTIDFISNGSHGVLTELVNRGVIEVGVSNADQITALTNEGVIQGGSAAAIDNQGVIGTLTNNGLITGTNALWNASGSAMLLVNAGTIEGDISNSGNLTISGGSGGTIGTLTGLNGSIGAFTGSALIFDTGALVLNDVISQGVYVIGTGGSLTNTGTIGSISGVSVGSIASLVSFANEGQIGVVAATQAIAVENSGSIDSLMNSGTISASVTATGGSTVTAYGIANNGVMGVLTNSGKISGDNAAVSNQGSIHLFTNSGLLSSAEVGFGNGGITDVIVNSETGTIESAGGGAFPGGILNWGGSIGSIENRGLISAGASGAAVLNGGAISELKNSGSIENLGGGGAIYNSHILETIENSGRIIGGGGTIPAIGGTFAAITNYDVIGTLTNSGTIEGLGAGAGIGNFVVSGLTGAITVLTNTGAITGRIAIENAGEINLVANSGTIKGSGSFGLSNTGTIHQLTNAGLLEGGNGLWNWGQIDSIENSGTINGTTSAGLGNTSGAIGTLSNSGLITGKYSAIGNTGTMSIVNSGTIAGDITNAGQLTISGGANGAFGTVTGLNGALATVTGNSIDFDTGALEVHALFTNTLNVTGTSGTLSNTGTINTLAVTSSGSLATLMNSGLIETGTAAAAIDNLGSIGLISNSGVIQGNIDSASALTFGGNTAPGTLTGGIITAPSVEFASGMVVLENDIHGNVALTGSTVVVAAGERITGDYSQSGGVLDISSTGLWTISGTAHITGGTVIAGSLSAANNYLAGESAGTLIDAASGSSYSGLKVQFGGISELIAGPDTSSTDDLRIIYLNDYIGGNLPTLGNTGSIGGGDYGVFVAAGGSIGTFSNSGTIGGTQDAFSNSGTIGLLQNDGIISDGSGIDNSGLILVLTNNGLIEGDAGIHNTGTIGSLINAGTITGPNFAIDNAGSLGPISNTGTIDGHIRSTSPLFIAGGTGSTFGILTGGTITADVNFTSGNLRLSDAIVGQASNSGAVLQLASAVNITGSYSQTSGTLDLGVNRLTVSGAADFSGGAIAASLSPTANYLVGQSVVLIDGGSGSSYAGATLNLSSLPVLSVAANTSGEDLAVTVRNNYIGGSLASLSNTGTLSGSAYGVYVASTGTLGALANTGTLRGTQYAIYSAGSLGTVTNTGVVNGNIYSAGVLALAGSGGTLSGGTITAAGVSIASGSLLLADNINVGSGTVSAGTASVELSSKVSIIGNYLQTGGVLISDVTDPTTYGALAVSGSASITNTTITVNGTSVRAGQTYTIVDAGAASSYTGDTIRLVGAHYRAELSTVGDDLVASIKAMFGEIGTAKGGGAAVMGGVLDRLSDNVGLQTMIDRLSQLSDADLGRALEQAAPAEVGGSSASLQRVSLIEGLIGRAVGSRHSRSAGAGWSLWQEVLGGTAQRSAVSGTAGYDTTAAGLVVGADNRIQEDLLVGAALSWSAGWNAGRGDVSGNANGMNGFALTGYGSWTKGALTVNGRVAVGLDHYNQRRVMTYLDEKAAADYSGQHYVIAADGGYDFDLAPGLTLTPQASLRWLRLTADGYSEAGVGGLVVGSVTADQVQSGLGAKLAMAVDTRFGLVVPEFRATWLHDFGDDYGETSASLGGLSFTTRSARITANGIQIGTGVTFYQTDATSLLLEYDGEFRDDYTAHGGMLQFSLKL